MITFSRGAGRKVSACIVKRRDHGKLDVSFIPYTHSLIHSFLLLGVSVSRLPFSDRIIDITIANDGGILEC